MRLPISLKAVKEKASKELGQMRQKKTVDVNYMVKNIVQLVVCVKEFGMF